MDFELFCTCFEFFQVISLINFTALIYMLCVYCLTKENQVPCSFLEVLKVCECHADQWKLIFGPTSDDNTGGGLKFVAEDNSTFYKKSLRFFFIRVACKLQVAWGENWRTQLKGIVLSRSTLKNSLDSKSIFLTLAGFSIFYKMQISYCFGLSKAFLSQLDTFFSASHLWESTSCFI